MAKCVKLHLNILLMECLDDFKFRVGCWLACLEQKSPAYELEIFVVLCFCKPNSVPPTSADWRGRSGDHLSGPRIAPWLERVCRPADEVGLGLGSPCTG